MATLLTLAAVWGRMGRAHRYGFLLPALCPRSCARSASLEVGWTRRGGGGRSALWVSENLYLWARPMRPQTGLGKASTGKAGMRVRVLPVPRQGIVGRFGTPHFLITGSLTRVATLTIFQVLEGPVCLSQRTQRFVQVRSVIRNEPSQLGSSSYWVGPLHLAALT